MANTLINNFLVGLPRLASHPASPPTGLVYVYILDSDGSVYTKNSSGTETALGAGGGSGVVETVVAGTGITVDATDPANPIVAATGDTASPYKQLFTTTEEAEIGNDTGPVDLFSGLTVTGSLTIAADTVEVGDRLHFKAAGFYETPASGDTSINMYLESSSGLLTNPLAFSPSAGVTGKWFAEFEVIINDSTTAYVYSHGVLEGINAQSIFDYLAFDISASNTLSFTVVLGQTDPDMRLVLQSAFGERTRAI